MTRSFAFVVLAACYIARANAAPTASDLAHQLERSGFDPADCYRVVNVHFSRGEMRIYFNSGYLIFAKPVNGNRPAAMFAADTEGGDAEVLLLPPNRGERASLAHFTGSPNLDEHFKGAVLIFGDNTGTELEQSINNDYTKRMPEAGALLAEKWTPILHNLASSFTTRIVGDLLSADRSSGMFYMAIGGSRLGNFDIIYDPQSADETTLGQLVNRNGESYFNVWTSFANASTGPAREKFALDHYRIDTTIDSDLNVNCITRFALKASADAGSAISLQISPRMHVRSATVNGQAAEVFQADSLRSTLISGEDNQEFLLVSPIPIEQSKTYEIEIKNDGGVIAQTPDRLFFVSSRSNWYPRHKLDFSTFDLTFRYPRSLQVVSTGEVIEEKEEGETRMTHYRTTMPIRFAGFNLGDFKSHTVERGGYTIHVYGNKTLPAGAPSLERPTTPPTGARLELLGEQVGDAFAYMATLFGPPPLNTLAVTPIPGTFGQGFPGLVYLSTLAYLEPAQRPASARGPYQEMFYSDMIAPHETAHQWFGNLVIPASYHEEWLIESLANYAALFAIEKKDGPGAIQAVLDQYRNDLLANSGKGSPVESAGPITWGYRLRSSEGAETWRAITYEKGTWILHMLRRQMGDENFHALLRNLCEHHHSEALTTDDFRALAEQALTDKSHAPDLRSFFDDWVYGTGIPAIKLTYSIRAKTVAGTLTQSGVGEDFSALIPIEFKSAHKRIVKWLSAGTDPTPFTVALDEPATSVQLDVKDGLVTAKK